VAEELVEPPEQPSVAEEIARLWHTSAFDLEGRRQLLTRALAAGRPVGTRYWAGDCKQDTGSSESDGQNYAAPAPNPPKTMTRSSKCETWKDAGRATPDEIIELQRLGFKVEDLGAEYGPAHQGAFRWINIVAGEFQQDVESRSEAEAWAAAKAAAAANERTIK
jgi:hypothetical protein